MTERRQNFISRFSYFWSDARAVTRQDRALIFTIVGWLISLLFFVISLKFPSHVYLLLFIIHIYFFFRLLNTLYKNIRIPIELLLLLLQVIFCFALLLLNYSYKIQVKSIAVDLLQVFIISILIFTFSLLVVYNARGKKYDIIGLLLLGFLAHFMLLHGHPYLLSFIQVLIFLTLLAKTDWLNELTRVECIVYWIIIYFLFQFTVVMNPAIDTPPEPFARSVVWYTLPMYLYFLFKYYLLVLLIKIPFVLIYNHARLSTKLWIAGLFQSTFPQFIQLFMLLLIFYFFLSGWQAENLRKTIKRYIDKRESSYSNRSSDEYIISSADDEFTVKLPGYRPYEFNRRLPEKGVLKLSRDQHSKYADSNYFLYFKSTRLDSSIIHCIKLDTLFLREITNDLRVLAGTTLDVYPFIPDRWSSYIFKMDFIYQSDRNIQIFPFALFPHDDTPDLSIPIDKQPFVTEKVKGRFNFGFESDKQFPAGRVFLPLFDNDDSSGKYIAFDIIFRLSPELFWTGVPQIILFMILIYFLVNALLIRRVVKFGSQINQSIVQKFQLLKDGIKQIASGNLNYKITMEGEDEFVELAARFNYMGERLKATIAEAREKERLQYELQLARDVQLSLLPLTIPEIPGYHLAASLVTANEVGGDFYDIIPLDDQRYLFTIGDVSGKGSSAALYMAQCMSLIRYTRQFTEELSEICSKLNGYFTATITDRHIFVTAIIGVLDMSVNSISFIRAGHTEPLYVPENEANKITLLKSSGMGIGLTNNGALFNKTNKIFHINMNAGDSIIFYTDGVIEASRSSLPTNDVTHNEMQMYGEERLHQLIDQIRRKNASDIIRSLEENIETFYAGQPRVDDHTLLVIQRNRL